MKKLLNKKGFTLMEMMIVVAIIVILVAIAVPNFNSSLQRANKATDEANLKAAKTAGTLKAVDKASHGKWYYYDLTTGELTGESGTELTAKKDGIEGSCENHTDASIVVSIAADGKVVAKWSDGTDCK